MYSISTTPVLKCRSALKLRFFKISDIFSFYEIKLTQKRAETTWICLVQIPEWYQCKCQTFSYMKDMLIHNWIPCIPEIEYYDDSNSQNIGKMPELLAKHSSLAVSAKYNGEVQGERKKPEIIQNLSKPQDRKNECPEQSICLMWPVKCFRLRRY